MSNSPSIDLVKLIILQEITVVHITQYLTLVFLFCYCSLINSIIVFWYILIQSYHFINFCLFLGYYKQFKNEFQSASAKLKFIKKNYMSILLMNKI